jgi:hypothetical protein
MGHAQGISRPRLPRCGSANGGGNLASTAVAQTVLVGRQLHPPHRPYRASAHRRQQSVQRSPAVICYRLLEVTDALFDNCDNSTVANHGFGSGQHRRNLAVWTWTRYLAAQ